MCKELQRVPVVPSSMNGEDRLCGEVINGESSSVAACRAPS